MDKADRNSMNKLHVLFVTDGNGYTAQCLQYDIAAQGETIKDAKRAFEYAITAEVGYLASINKTLDDLPAAPQYYWNEFQQASQVKISLVPYLFIDKKDYVC